MHLRFDRIDAELTNRVEVMINDLRDLITEGINHGTGAFAALGRTLVEQEELLTEIREDLPAPGAAGFVATDHDGLGTLDAYLADVANFAGSHRGWAAQAGLWFNPPIQPFHHAGRVDLGVVTERIAEVPFVLQQLAALSPGSCVLDVGCSESTLAISLATLGITTTAVDPRGYPLSHPNLQVVRGDVEDIEGPARFDAVVSLSTLEHVGIDSYGSATADDGDLAAVKHLRDLTRPEGLFIMTAPFGRVRFPELQRVYDRERLDALLVGWEPIEMSFLVRSADDTWSRTKDVPGSDDEATVLLVARKPAT